MYSDTAQDAINAALKANWKDALKINLLILETDKDDIDSLNRLARAYAELGDISKARTTSQKVLKIDPFNSIALRSLDRWKGLKKGEKSASKPSDPQMFLEEPGKTKICSLLFLGDSNLIAKLDAGDVVKINTHSHRVNVCTTDNKYVGRLPDDLSARLKKLIKLGNIYSAYIKSINTSEVKIFIKEEKRGKSVSDIPSFTAEKIDYITFTPPELVHDKIELSDDSIDEE